MRVLLFIISMCSYALNVNAEVFMCEENGQKIFSDFPCSEKAGVVKTVGHKVTIKLPLEQKDIVYFCSTVMNAWDQQLASNHRQDTADDDDNLTDYERQARSLRQQQTTHASTSPKISNRLLLDRVSNEQEVAKKYPHVYRLLTNMPTATRIGAVYMDAFGQAGSNERNRVQSECERLFIDAGHEDAR